MSGACTVFADTLYNSVCTHVHKVNPRMIIARLSFMAFAVSFPFIALAAGVAVLCIRIVVQQSEHRTRKLFTLSQCLSRPDKHTLSASDMTSRRREKAAADGLCSGGRRAENLAWISRRGRAGGQEEIEVIARSRERA